jgi:hypothetical protein
VPEEGTEKRCNSVTERILEGKEKRCRKLDEREREGRFLVNKLQVFAPRVARRARKPDKKSSFTTIGRPHGCSGWRSNRQDKKKKNTSDSEST